MHRLRSFMHDWFCAGMQLLTAGVIVSVLLFGVFAVRQALERAEMYRALQQYQGRCRFANVHVVSPLLSFIACRIESPRRHHPRSYAGL
jgi:hypothetical protein